MEKKNDSKILELLYELLLMSLKKNEKEKIDD